MSEIEEGTLVIYHGTVRAYRGDLAFVREWSIAPDDRRHFVLDTLCYDQNATAEYERITTYGTVDAVRDEFTVVRIPKLPEPLAYGNYLVHGTPWRKTPEGWYTWANYSEQWKFAPDLMDWCARGEMAVYIGPLPQA